MKATKKILNFKINTFVIALFSLFLIPALGLANSYPTKPITLVAPYSAGGASDLASRTLASVVDKYIGEPVQVVNRTGASGTVGSEYVSTAEPDGYTLLLARVGCNAVAPALQPELPYDWDDFTMLGLLEVNPFVYIVNPESDIHDLDDMKDYIKENSGRVTYGTSGPGTMLHLGANVLLSAFGEDADAATAIPYRGGGEAISAVMGGHVDFVCVNIAPAMSNIQAGKVRTLAVTTEESVDEIPDVPTVSEAGYPELETVTGWSALFGPPGLDDEVVNAWTNALQKVKKDDSWNRMTINMGNVPDIRNPDETKQFIKKQFTSFREIAQSLGLEVKFD